MAMTDRTYSAYHPQLGECGHKHDSLTMAVACVNTRKRPIWTCTKCGHNGHRVSEPKNCPDCNEAKKPGESTATRHPATLHTVHASDDGGKTWGPVTVDELVRYGNGEGKFSAPLREVSHA